MIHGQVSRRKRSLAVVALTGSPFALPPLGAAEFLGFVFFPCDLLGIGRDEIFAFHGGLV